MSNTLRPSMPNAEAMASNVETRSDPIICQGDRLMRIDGETLSFEGDAVIAEKGCDLYISNARIRAGGVGIIARQARVHIVNSTIGGSRGSYEASEGAEIYVARSTFADIGKIRRLLHWEPRVSFEAGVAKMLEQLDAFRDAPVWTPDSISVATKEWFTYLSRSEPPRE